VNSLSEDDAGNQAQDSPANHIITESTKPGNTSSKSKSKFEEALYAKRQKIYPREVHGIFARLRITGVVALMGIFYGLPWLTINGHQAVLWDLPNRKFHIFGLVFWPQDFFYLSALLIIAALSLFFFTALAGRLWCGYACPQTVWTEVFLWIERSIEGDRPKQIKLDKSKWTADKIIKKLSKHAIWIGLSLWTGYTFVGYFTAIRDLGAAIFVFETGPWETFWVLFYGFATYGNAGWLREQVCIYMCPYARFQSAMFDRNTLVISYDKKRGEPRGSRRRRDNPAELGLGDCVNCTLCVQVCPTGIDIRNGLQYECIGCAACVDACDDVMDKIGYAKGLIRYTTENALEGISTKLVRPRVVIYAAILLILLSVLGISLYQRVPLGLDIIRDRNALYRETQDGLIENVYTLKILNKDHQTHNYLLAVTGPIPITVHRDSENISVGAGGVGELTVRVQVDPADMQQQSAEIEFSLTAVQDNSIEAREVGRFVGPVPGK
jgi:cytochrome c oxidase accessory protein FixG